MSRRRKKYNTMSKLPRDKRMIEKLEERLLFNTIITDTNPLTSTPATQTLEYKDARGKIVRIVVHGDVSAEFVFGRETKGDEKTGAGGNQLILGDAVGTTMVDDKGKVVANTEDGRDLFHVYIAQASIDSYISIAEVPAISAKVRPMTPFTGSVTLVVSPNRGTVVTKTTDGNTGNIYLGARTRDTAADIDNEADNPVRTAVFNGLGILAPNAKHRLVAGISTAPDVSIGKFMFAGAVSGEVRFQGSIETFYCGALLTGTTEGQPEGTPLDPGNFFVQGDMRNLLVKGSIGTDAVPSSSPDRAAPTYWAGTDIEVHGRVGQIKTGDDYLATGTVFNDNAGLGLRTRQQEIEVRIDPGQNRGSFTEFENGQFGDNESFFNNDTFTTAQFLGSINSKQTGNNSIQLNGLFQWIPKVDDSADYYAVALMAGQSVGVRLIAPNVATQITVNGQVIAGTETKSLLHVGVFDPDDRLIASDYSNVTDTTSQSLDADPAQQNFFSFTADKPGIYRFAVAKDAPGFGPAAGQKLGIEQPYQLQITGVGNLGLGALVAEQTIYATSALLSSTTTGGFSFDDDAASMQVIHGDFGAEYSNTDAIVSTGGFAGIAVGGDFRAIDSMQMGQINNGAFGDAPYFEAITGSVGMIRTRGTGSDQLTLFNDVPPVTTTAGRTNIIQPIGGDVQYIIAPVQLGTDLAVNGSVGVVQVKQWGFQNYAGSLSVNLDGKGKPGTIDLIDVTGNLGTLQAGGPVISTNAGGNVRYIHLSNSSTAFRPVVFGGSQPEQTTYAQGQSADITDDSGGLVHITPTQEDLIDPTTGLPQLDPVTLAPISNSGTLTVLTYPIARSLSDTGRGTGGGGSVIIRVDSTRGMEVSTSGGSCEIGTLNSTGNGAGLITDPGDDGIPNTGDEDPGPDGIANSGDEPFELDPNSIADNSIELKGSLTDIYSITGNSFNEIINQTGGEIVNTNIGTIGTLEASNLGFGKSSIRPGMATEGQTVADNPGTGAVDGDTFPFLHAKNAIVINGGGEASPAVSLLEATESIGNVMIMGKAQEISANADGKGVKGVFEGIIGAIFAQGELRDVQVGEGLMPSGTGNMGKAGIYCVSATSPTAGTVNYNGRIDRVRNQGAGSDIRGDIVSDTGIGSVEVHDGSIINSDIEVITATAGQGGAGGGATGSGADLHASTEFGEVRVIVDNGTIDSIVTSGYGGIIGLLETASSIGTVTSLHGFGIINSEFSVLGNGRFGAVTADGYGVRGCIWDGGQSLESVTVLGDGHRLTTTSFEPSLLYSGSLAVDPFFGTKPNPLTDLFVVTGTTPAMPQRKGTSASGSFDLSTIAVSRDVTFIKANTMKADVFNIANDIGSLATDDYVDTLLVTCGKLDTFAIGKDAARVDVEVAGPVATVYIGGSFKGTSKLAASGPNGQIGTVTTKNSLYGNISAAQKIGTIKVGTVYGSQGTHSGGNLTLFQTGGDVATGSVLDVNKTLQSIIIGGDFQDGATIRAGVFGTKDIAGADEGDFVVKT